MLITSWVCNICRIDSALLEQDIIHGFLNTLTKKFYFLQDIQTYPRQIFYKGIQKPEGEEVGLSDFDSAPTLSFWKTLFMLAELLLQGLW